MRLVIALADENILPQLDAESAMYALEGLQELEKRGWKFIPPATDNSDAT
jgi:hypothetical protein